MEGDHVLKRILASAALVAMAATGAAAAVMPGPRIATPDSFLVQVAQPNQTVVKKSSNTVVKKGPAFNKAPVPKKSFAPTVKKSTPFVKGPIVKGPKGPGTIVKGPGFKGPGLKPVGKLHPQFVHVKSHHRRKWHGYAIGGVVLGTILAASYYYNYEEPPAPNLCWYWTSSARVRGYWDYCVYPDD